MILIKTGGWSIPSNNVDMEVVPVLIIDFGTSIAIGYFLECFTLAAGDQALFKCGCDFFGIWHPNWWITGPLISNKLSFNETSTLPTDWTSNGGPENENVIVF